MSWLTMVGIAIFANARGTCQVSKISLVASFTFAVFICSCIVPSLSVLLRHYRNSMNPAVEKCKTIRQELVV